MNAKFSKRFNWNKNNAKNEICVKAFPVNVTKNEDARWTAIVVEKLPEGKIHLESSFGARSEAILFVGLHFHNKIYWIQFNLTNKILKMPTV